MIPIVSSQLTAKRCSAQRRVAKSLLILPIIGCVLACASCTDQEGSGMIDTEPLGLGLRTIGYSVVAAAVLGVLGKLIK